jgi:hypothetical protein
MSISLKQKGGRRVRTMLFSFDPPISQKRFNEDSNRNIKNKIALIPGIALLILYIGLSIPPFYFTLL